MKTFSQAFLSLSLLAATPVYSQNNKCSADEEKEMRDKFQHFSHEVIKSGGICFDMTMQKDLRFLSTDLTSLQLATGKICFQSGKTFIETKAPFDTKLLVTDNKGYEINSSFGKKEFSFFSKIDETPLKNIAKSFEKISQDQYSFWSDFRTEWECANFIKGSTLQAKFVNRTTKLHVDHFDIQFPLDSSIPSMINVAAADTLMVEFHLEKSKDTAKIEIPDLLKAPEGYEITRAN